MLYKPGHNTPPHLFLPERLYMLTGAVYKQRPLIRTQERKTEWIRSFLRAAELFHWQAIAWVVLDNHYHAVIASPQDVGSLPKFVASYHKYTAQHWNQEDLLTGRKVWWNYWDTCIRSQEDYINRLRYIFWNPIKHGYVHEPNQYRHSNYREFLEAAWFQADKAPVEVKDVPEF